MNKKTNVFGVLCFGISLFGFAQQQANSTSVEQLDEVVITDSRFELKRENSGKTIIKISKQEIERNQGRTISELISTMSGIEINGSRSNAGQNLGVYVRGGNNRQVLVLIDGVQVGDPSQIYADYDFRLLNLNQIESIEIIKGAASTLYGSGAATAVINITTKKAANEKIKGVFASSFGTNQSKADQNYNIADFNNSVAIGGTLNKFTYRTSFNQQYTDGLSAAITDQDEKDPYSKYGVDINLGYRFSKAFSLNVFGNYTDINSNYDNGAFTEGNNVFKSEQARVGLTSVLKHANGSVHLNAAFSEYDRAFISAFGEFNSEAKNYTLDVYNKYVINKVFYTIVGLNVIDNRALYFEEEKFTNTDPYVNAVYVSDFGLNLNVGARLNNHSEYGTHLVYSANPSFVFKLDEGNYVKLLGAYATSFITPTLYQLFGGGIAANPDLKPEENRTIEGGVEFKLLNKTTISGLYFNRKEKNTITYFDADGDFNTWDDAQYINGSLKRKVQGVEVELKTELIDGVLFNSNYTFTEDKDGLLNRVAKHKANAGIACTITNSTDASLTYQYSSKRYNFGIPMDAFSVFNLYVGHKALKNKVKFFGGIDNILNEDYEDVPGYVTKGRNVRLGFQLTL
ncbi:TonB-dependent receptor plug domain-containing protein [Snuella lapsa]|uniref:TonB-dependent receptor n=1 Tax=Snuella lapsa TaxID=870481 RepID=A0ABP6YN08_9FLAO